MFFFVLFFVLFVYLEAGVLVTGFGACLDCIFRNSDVTEFVTTVLSSLFLDETQ